MNNKFFQKLYIKNVLIKKENYINIILYLIYILKFNLKFNTKFNLKNLSIKLNIENKTLWHYLNKLYIYKILKTKFFLELNNLRSLNKKFLIYKKNYKIFYSNDKFIYKNLLFNNNKFKQKLINKNYFYNFKLNKFNKLKYRNVFIWPLILTIKPYIIIIKNIFFKETYKFKKKGNKFKLKTSIDTKGSLFEYIINKYSKIKNYSTYNKNYNLFLKNKIQYLGTTNNKKRLKWFYNVFNNQKQTLYSEKLIYNKLYNLILFWFLIFWNKINQYITLNNNFIWLNKFFFLELSTKTSKYIYYFFLLYKDIIYNINVQNDKYFYFFKYIFKKVKIFNLYNNYNKFFYFLKAENEYNLLDLTNNSEYYKFKSYYKNKYFIQKIFIFDIKQTL